MKTILSFVCLLGLILAGLRLVGRVPTPREETLASLPPPESRLITESAVDSPQVWFRNEASEAQQLNAAAALASSVVPENLDEAREWARQNTAAALTWVLNEPAGPKHDAVSEIVCSHLAQSDPAQAVALAERCGVGCSNVLENLVQQWAEIDESAACRFADNKPAGVERDHLLSRIALARSRTNPAAAAKLVAEQISPGVAQNEAAISVLYQWALRDPDAAWAWAQLFPASNLRDRAMREVANVAAAQLEP